MTIQDIRRSLALAALAVGCTTTAIGEEVSAITGADTPPAPIYEAATQSVYDDCDFPSTGACKCTQTTWCSPDNDCTTQTATVNKVCDTRAFASGADCTAGCGAYCRSSTACVTYSCTTAEGCADAVPIKPRREEDDVLGGP